MPMVHEIGLQESQQHVTAPECYGADFQKKQEKRQQAEPYLAGGVHSGGEIGGRQKTAC